jgi:ABC-type nitrate/sulfonate/bicarbonate transport system ATPase subunit
MTKVSVARAPSNTAQPLPAQTPHLRLSGITHRFGSGESEVTAVQGIDLDVPTGRFISIIGQSGCGKSTLFNILAGLIVPTEGTVEHDGRDVTGRAGIISYMLQKDLLLPWRTVIDNVIFGLELQGVPKAQARDQAMPYLERYGLGGFATKYPSMLSGGMRQRAALLRTLLCNKDLIMLDEPFAALDAQTRFRMQAWLLELWKDFSLTILFVTHDIDEAIFLSDEIVVLSPRPGRIRDRIIVDAPRPRGPDFVTSPEFARIKALCLKMLFEDGADHDAPAEERA